MNGLEMVYGRNPRKGWEKILIEMGVVDDTVLGKVDVPVTIRPIRRRYKPSIHGSADYYREMERRLESRKRYLETIEASEPHYNAFLDGITEIDGLKVYVKDIHPRTCDFLAYRFKINDLAKAYPWFARMVGHSDADDSGVVKIAIEYVKHVGVLFDDEMDKTILLQLLLFVRVCQLSGVCHNDLHLANFSIVEVPSYTVVVDDRMYEFKGKDGKVRCPVVYDYELSHISGLQSSPDFDGAPGDLGVLKPFEKFLIYYDYPFYFGNIIKVISSLYDGRRKPWITPYASYIYRCLHYQDPLTGEAPADLDSLMKRIKDNRGHIRCLFQHRKISNNQLQVTGIIDFFVKREKLSYVKISECDSF